MNLGEFAAALGRAAELLESEGAERAANAGGGAFLGELKDNTPVKTGALRNSEDMAGGGGGGGGSASVTVSTHLPLYASFREYGGTIHAHDRPRGGWTGSPTGTYPRRWGRHQHTLHWAGGGFPLEVTQKGSGYMARTVEWAEGGGMDGPIQTAISRVLRDAGL
jgi:hypothetical protein